LKLYYKDEYCTLLQGDCLEGMQKMAEKGLKFDAIITDLPYGTTACKWDTIIPFDKMWECLNNLRKDNSPIILFGSEPFSSLLRCSNLKEFKYDWIWRKNTGTGFATAKYQPLKYHEIISIFSIGKIKYNPIPTERFSEASKRVCKNPVRGGGKTTSNHVPMNIVKVQYDSETKTPESVLEFKSVPNAGGNKLHPTQKPIELLEYLIKTYTNEGDIILDFTCGSGTTLLASKKLNRKCYGVELEKKYCEVTKNRLIELDNTP